MTEQTIRRNRFNRTVAVILTFVIVGGALAFAIN